MPLPIYELLPFEGLAEARFGEERAVLQRRLGEHRTFRKGVASVGLCDHYTDRGLILHHDDRDRLVFIEVGPATLHYRGVELVERPTGEVRAGLAALGHTGAGDDGLDYPDLGMTMTTHLVEGPDDGGEGDGGEEEEQVDGEEEDEDDDTVSEVYIAGLYPRDRRGRLGEFVRGTGTAESRDHVIVPHEGTEQVRLGADRHALRAMLGTCLEVVPEYGPAAEDLYTLAGLTLGFDAADRLVSLVVASLAQTVTCHGVQVLRRPYEEVVTDLAAKGVHVEHGELIGRAPGFDLLLAGDSGPHLPVAAVRIDGAGAGRP